MWCVTIWVPFTLGYWSFTTKVSHMQYFGGRSCIQPLHWLLVQYLVTLFGLFQQKIMNTKYFNTLSQNYYWYGIIWMNKMLVLAMHVLMTSQVWYLGSLQVKSERWAFLMRPKYFRSTSKAPVLTAMKSREVVCATGCISCTWPSHSRTL